MTFLLQDLENYILELIPTLPQVGCVTIISFLSHKYNNMLYGHQYDPAAPVSAGLDIGYVPTGPDVLLGWKSVKKSLIALSKNTHKGRCCTIC